MEEVAYIIHITWNAFLCVHTVANFCFQLFVLHSKSTNPKLFIFCRPPAPAEGVWFTVLWQKWNVFISLADRFAEILKLLLHETSEHSVLAISKSSSAVARQFGRSHFDA